MLGHYTCYACHDTWFRDLTDQEAQAYIEAHPELEESIRSGDIDSVDLGEILCDGCENYFQDETALALAEEGDDLEGKDGAQ